MIIKAATIPDLDQISRLFVLYVEENFRKLGVVAALLDKARQYGVQTQASWLML